jgi:iron complex outermembrane receptor protein
MIATLDAGTARAEDEEVVVREPKRGGFSSEARAEASPREVGDLAALVEPMPGVHVRRLGGDDSFATLSVRGSASTQVAVYLAGVPLSGGADPTLDLAALPLWPGVRARVFRSFAPATLGPGSLGGTLAVDPAGSASPIGTEIWTGVGSFGARKLRIGDVRALDASGRARIVTALSASRSDDDFGYVDPFASAAGRDAIVTRENAGHAGVSGLWSVVTPAGREGRLVTMTMVQARHQELPGTVKAPTPRQSLESNRGVTALELAFPAGAGEGVARAWARREDLRLRDDPRGGGSFGATRTDDWIFAAGGALGWRGGLGRGVQLDARLDGSGERFAPGTWVGASAPPGATRASAGMASDVSYQASRELRLSGALRADARSDGSSGTSTSDAQATGHAGAELAVDRVTFAAHVGRTARAPSFVELYGNRGAFLGNPALRTESAATVDAGARARLGAGTAHAALELVGFTTWADDLIVFVNEGAFGRARAANIGRAWIGGVEASARARVAFVEARATYTGLATENRVECAATAAPVACARPPLPGRPAHDVYADVAAHAAFVTVRYGVDVVSGMLADRLGTVQVPARVLQSAGVRVDVPGVPGLRLAADVRNLFDVRTGTYEGALGPVREPVGDAFEYPLPGRSLLVTARFTSPAPGD